MATDDFNDFSSVFSSIFYAKRNSPEKQRLILNFSSTTTSSYHSSVQTEKQDLPPLSFTKQFEQNSDTSKISFKGARKKKESFSKEKQIIYQPQQLSSFYSEIPLMKEVISSPSKTKKREKGKENSRTRQVLTDALIETKKRLSTQPKIQSSKEKITSRKKKKKQDFEKLQKQTIRLNHFISEEIVRTKEIRSEPLVQVVDSNARTQHEFFLNDNDPFPFTNLTEWLIWHEYYPELGFVREAYDIEQVPDEEDVEVFWVNIMNDPEFFNPNWRIAGSSIDIDSIKYQRRPDGTPEWDIISSYTDGFSIFFEDVYQILSQNSQGLQNYQYPILQFALKGLLLMELTYFDDLKQKWFRKGTVEDLMTRLKELDQFIIQQENLSAYQQNLKSQLMKNEWYIGLICFDLIVIQSTYLKHFSQNQLTEDEKIQVIKEENLNQAIGKKLSTIEKLEKIRVRNLQKKLKVSRTSDH